MIKNFVVDVVLDMAEINDRTLFIQRVIILHYFIRKECKYKQINKQISKIYTKLKI